MSVDVKLKISKWGNSLAIRLPIECTRVLGLKDGDLVDATITAAGELSLAPERRFDKEAFLSRLAKLHATLPKSGAVVERMRRRDRY